MENQEAHHHFPYTQKTKKRRPRFFKNSQPVHEIFFVRPSSLYFLPRRSIEEKQFSPSKKIFRERRKKNCSQGTKRIHRRRKCSKNLFCHRLLSRQKHRCAAEYTNKKVENKKNALTTVSLKFVFINLFTLDSAAAFGC